MHVEVGKPCEKVGLILTVVDIRDLYLIHVQRTVCICADLDQLLIMRNSFEQHRDRARGRSIESSQPGM